MPTQQISANATATAAAKASVKSPAVAAAAASGSVAVGLTGSTLLSAPTGGPTARRKSKEELVGVCGGGDTAAAAAAFSNGNSAAGDSSSGTQASGAMTILNNVHASAVAGTDLSSSIAAAKNSVKTQADAVGKFPARSSASINSDSAATVAGAPVKAKKKFIVVKKSEGSSEPPHQQQQPQQQQQQQQQHAGDLGARNSKPKAVDAPKKSVKQALTKSTHSVVAITAKPITSSKPSIVEIKVNSAAPENNRQKLTPPEDKPKGSSPVSKPKSTTSDNKLKSTTPESKVKSTIPETKSKSTTPETKSKSTTPETKSKSATPETKPKSTTPETKSAVRPTTDKPPPKTTTPAVVAEATVKHSVASKPESTKPKTTGTLKAVAPTVSTERPLSSAKSIAPTVSAERPASRTKPSDPRVVSITNGSKSTKPESRPKTADSKSTSREPKPKDKSTSSKTGSTSSSTFESTPASVSPRLSPTDSKSGTISSPPVLLDLPPKLTAATEPTKKKPGKRDQSPVQSNTAKVLSPIPKRTSLNSIPLLTHHHQRSVSDMPVKPVSVGSLARQGSSSPKRSNTTMSTHSTASLTVPKAPSQRPLSAGSLRRSHNQHSPTPSTTTSDRPLSAGTRKPTHKKASLSASTPLHHHPLPQHHVSVLTRTTLRDKKKSVELSRKPSEPISRPSMESSIPRSAVANSASSIASANNVPLTAALLAREKTDAYRQQIAPAQQHRGFFDRVKKKLKITDSQNSNNNNNNNNNNQPYPDESADDAVLQIKTTMRKQRKKSFNEDKPWKHHVDAVKLTENERKRYEGLWATNRGIHVPFLYPDEEDDPDSDSESDEEDSESDESDLEESDHEDPGEPLQSKSVENTPQAGTKQQQQQQHVHHTAVHEDDRTQSIHGIVVRSLWRRSRLSDDTLRQIWDLVDRRGDGCLDREGFLVGMWLVDQCLYGRKLPLKIDDTIWHSVGRLNVRVKIRKTKKDRKAERRTLRKREKEERRLKKKTKK